MASKHLKKWSVVRGLHETDKRDSEVQVSSYKISKSWRCIFSIGYTINNNVKPLYGNRWLLDLSRSFHNLNVELLCFTPESNIILHAKLLQKNL